MKETNESWKTVKLKLKDYEHIMDIQALYYRKYKRQIAKSEILSTLICSQVQKLNQKNE